MITMIILTIVMGVLKSHFKMKMMTPDDRKSGSNQTSYCMFLESVEHTFLISGWKKLGKDRTRRKKGGDEKRRTGAKRGEKF